MRISQIRPTCEHTRNHAQTPDAFRADTASIGGCELAPTTAVRAHAQANYSQRFRAAYGHHCSRPRAPRCLASTKSPAPRIERPRDPRCPLTVTSLADTHAPVPQTGHTCEDVQLPTTTDQKPPDGDRFPTPPRATRLHKTAHKPHPSGDRFACGRSDYCGNLQYKDRH